MINQLEIPLYLEKALPEISEDLLSQKKNTAYDLINTLNTFTDKNIEAHNYQVVKRCFQVADKLYNRGNSVVQNAIQNVFVYSFTKMFQSHPAEKKELLAMIPITLYSLYITQIYHPGC